MVLLPRPSQRANLAFRFKRLNRNVPFLNFLSLFNCIGNFTLPFRFCPYLLHTMPFTRGTLLFMARRSHDGTRRDAIAAPPLSGRPGLPVLS